MRRSYKFALRPSAYQERLLVQQLDLCRNLYNAALEQRIREWTHHRRSVTYYDQSAELKHIQADVEGYARTYQRVLADVLRRLDKAYKAFFRRVKAGGTPGFPRFKSRNRYDSFVYNQSGFKIQGARLQLSKLCTIRMKQYRDLPDGAVIKQVTVKREADGWYAILACQVPQPDPLPATGHVVGIDVGLHALTATSDGEIVDAPKPYVKNLRRLRHASRTVSRRKKGSNRRRKAVILLRKQHQVVARQRKHFLDGVSKSLIQHYDVIGIEALNLKGMAQGLNRGFRRSFHDAALGTLLHLVTYKAESAGRVVVKVDPRGTSQLCSGCGTTVQKTLNDRVHSCSTCGLVEDRDINAAINIRTRALRALRGGDTDSGSPVKREDCEQVGSLSV